MEGILIIVVFIAGVFLLFAFRSSFIETHKRSFIHLSHIIIMILYVFSIVITSEITPFFSILCWISLAAVFVYYVNQYGLPIHEKNAEETSIKVIRFR